MTRVADWPAGIGLHVHAELDSTLNEAARIAPSLSAPAWILTYNQTQGRGRRGRPWAMPSGNFAGALVLRPQEPPATVALRSFVAALALADALSEVTGRPELLALKWPNDVLLAGGKVAGILLEGIGQGGQVSHLAIGIGVNLAEAPPAEALEPHAVQPVSLLGATGAQIAPEEFLSVLARSYAAREAVFTTQGFAPIREAWLARAARLGERITARTGGTATTGIFETIDAQGALVLATSEGRRAIPAAEVFF
ncbi:biotin--[acetyl-CoA-carboxylase] ligase [Haematobacter genomosp. 1]|uniref:biotin--[acetyl-CoA-carboxylase] ligase n=1 Tax=Haematobacter genomosp. 1 TaxID=366618 RepID=UPI0015C5A95F|nr:biotin--[acetyl-CoA-carboxylase] ligase [Haematobacter genomosp. 1]